MHRGGTLGHHFWLRPFSLLITWVGHLSFYYCGHKYLIHILCNENSFGAQAHPAHAVCMPMVIDIGTCTCIYQIWSKSFVWWLAKWKKNLSGLCIDRHFFWLCALYTSICIWDSSCFSIYYSWVTLASGFVFLIRMRLYISLFRLRMVVKQRVAVYVTNTKLNIFINYFLWKYTL